MSTAPSLPLVSLDEFLTWPDEDPAYELLDGIVEQKPVGSLRHSRAARRLQRILDTHPATAGGEALTELGKSYRQSPRGNHRVPDLSYFAAGNVPPEDADYPDNAPDLCAEVRSRGQSRAGLEARLRFLLQNGVRVGLLIEPDNESVTVFEATGIRTFRRDETVTVAAFPGLAFTASELFS